MISFFEKAHLNSSVRLLLELHCVIVIKHVTFFTIRCEITSNSGIHIYLSDLIKNIGGLTDWAKKKARIGGFAYPYSPPSSHDS